MSEPVGSEKERLAQALRDGDMETFTAAVRKANVHHCCSGCDARGHCTHGYEGPIATPSGVQDGFANQPAPEGPITAPSEHYQPRTRLDHFEDVSVLDEKP
jgi:hypothetical protein